MSRICFITIVLVTMTTTARAEPEPDATDVEPEDPTIPVDSQPEDPFRDEAPTEPAPDETRAQPIAKIAPSQAIQRSSVTRSPSPYRHAVSVQLATLDITGLTLIGEHNLQRHNSSVAVSAGIRSSARGEYDSLTVGAGVELRRWLSKKRPVMTGAYLGVRTDLARTTIDDAMEGRSIGSVTTWTTGVSIGYRWVFLGKVELTPSIGAAFVVERGTHSPATARGGGILGLTSGVVF